jgi:serine/threonine protein kinase
MDSFTQTGTILGTAGYLSPEQARGERATAASDRYALGIVAWELLTGKRPFQSATPTAEALAHVNSPVPSAHAANGALPASFDAVFERALAKDPAARYPHASDFVGELRSAVHEDAGDTGWIEPVTRTSAPTRVTAQPSNPRRWWIPLLVAAMIAGGVLAAVLATRDGKPQAAPRTVVRTVTGPGTTLRQTVTSAPATSAPATSSPTTASSGSSGTSLNDAGFAKMQAGDYAGALPLLEQAVQKLNGTGSTSEAYADYNLAYTRRALGQCTDVLALLDRSQAIQGHRKEIDSLRKDARKQCR